MIVISTPLLPLFLLSNVDGLPIQQALPAAQRTRQSSISSYKTHLRNWYRALSLSRESLLLPLLQLRSRACPNNRSQIPHGDTFYILNFPIDRLTEVTEHLMEMAIQLNPRRIALCNPLSSQCSWTIMTAYWRSFYASSRLQKPLSA